MKKHNGMRPHDIAVLLKIASKKSNNWLMKDLANELGISSSEVSESINRSVIAGLVGKDKKNVHRLALMDFLVFGLPYVYPQQPGAITRGIETAHSAAPLNAIIQSGDFPFVWPFAKGEKRGQAIEPLYPQAPEACLKDAYFYELMALTDALRIGKAREKKIAAELLKKRIYHA